MKIFHQLTALALGTLTLSYCTPPSDTVQADETAEVTYAFAEDHAMIWDEAIVQIEEIAEAMPEDMYSYKPHDSIMTFAEQLMHIGGSSKVLANMFLKDIQPADSPAMDANAMSKAEIMAYVKTNLVEAGEIMKSMTDEQLQEEIKSFSGKAMTRQQGLMFVHDHLTNHKGQANLYVRVSGNEPAEYRYY